MSWSNITTIPRSQKIMLKTASGMQVVGSVRPGANIQKNKNGKLVIEGTRAGMKNKNGIGSVRVVAWQPLGKEVENVQTKVGVDPKKAKEAKTKKIDNKPNTTPSLIQLLEQKLEKDRIKLYDQEVALLILKKYME
jgi:hypothetical protein